MIKQFELKDIQLHLLLGPAALHKRASSLQNSVHRFWLESWWPVFEKSNSLDSLDTDDFYRQHVVYAISQGSKIIACEFSTFFDLGHPIYKKHSYFSHFQPESFALIEERGYQTAMTGEYLTATPDWRKRNTGISLGSVLVGLNLKLLKAYNIDVLFGSARKDLKVNSLVSEFGFQTLIPSIIKCNYDCELMYVDAKSFRSHPDASTQGLIDRLWQNAEIIGNLNLDINERPRLKAA
jgi:hypothetical protein